MLDRPDCGCRASFTLAALPITLAFGCLYVACGALLQALFYGLNPVIVATILSTTHRLGRASIKSAPLGVLTAACLAAS